MLTAKRQYCFTLIELMVTFAVVAIVIGIAAPNFRSWLRDIQVRTSTESVLSGLQKARAEAIIRNGVVTFTLTDTNPDLAVVDSSWAINAVAPAELVASYTAKEGGASVIVNTLPIGATSISFNNLGRVVNNANSITQIDFTAPISFKQFRITIGLGGDVRMCDPKLPANSSPRACTA